MSWIIAVAGVVLVLAAWSMFVCLQTRPQPAQVRRVRIHGAYLPAQIHVEAGKPTRLIFRREETSPTSERVVFPDLGISVMLPAFKDVTVDLPAIEPGEHPFTSEMELLRGHLIVDARRTEPAGHRPAHAIRSPEHDSART